MRTQTSTGLGIVNPMGDLWTDEVFETPEAAIKYLQDFWKGVGPNSFDIALWKLTPVIKTVAQLTVPAEIWPMTEYLKTETV